MENEAKNTDATLFESDVEIVELSDEQLLSIHGGNSSSSSSSSGGGGGGCKGGCHVREEHSNS